MPRSRRWTERARRLRGDDGSASIEFITAGLLLLVPTVYLVLALGALQSAAFAVEGAARQASRVFVQAGDPRSAEQAAARAIAVTLADYGLDDAAADVAIDCSPDPRACLTRGGVVTVSVATTVPLPLMPPALGAEAPPGVVVSATSTQQVSRFWGSR